MDVACLFTQLYLLAFEIFLLLIVSALGTSDSSPVIVLGLVL